MGKTGLLLFLLLLLYPFLELQDVFLQGITVEGICFVVLAILPIVVLLSRSFVWRINGLDIFFFLFGVWYCIRMIMESAFLDEWWLISMGTGGLLYFCARNVMTERHLFSFLILGGFVQVFWFILQVYQILPSKHYLFLGTGSFFNPALLGCFWAFSLLVSLWQGLNDRRKKWRIVYMGASFVFFVCLFIIDSRASWVACCIGMGWCLWWKWRGTSFACSLRALFRTKMFVGIAVIIVLLVGIGWGLYALRPDSVQGRFLIWRVIGHCFMESPWLGQGSLAAAYMPAQADWFREFDGMEERLLAGENVYAFNEFLHVAFEAGIFGLFLFIMLLLVALLYAWRGNKDIVCCGGLLLAVMSFGFFSYPFSSSFLVKIVVCIFALIARSSGDVFSWTNGWVKASRWFVVILLMLSMSIVIAEYRTAHRADKLLVEMNQHALQEDDLKCSDAYLLGNPDFVLCYGKFLYRKGLYRQALPVLEQGFQLRPTSALTCDLGYCYQVEKRYAEAEQAYCEAAFMTPAYILPHYRLFCLYQEMGKMELAKAKAQYMLDMPVKIVNSSVLRYRHQARIFLREKEEVEYKIE